MPKDYKEIIRANGRIQDFYADFSTQTKSNEDSFLETSGLNAGDYKTFMSLLFPDTPVGIYEGKVIWENIKKISTAPGGATDARKKDLKRFVAEKIRVYHFDGNLTGQGQVTKDLLEFYGEVSAKPAPAPAAKPAGKAGPKAASPSSSSSSAPPTGTGARPSAYTAYDKENYVTIKEGLTALLRKCVQNPADGNKKLPALTMILVDTPDIDLKVRNCDTVSTFLNYTPGIIAAQMIPYLDVTFSLERKSTQQAAETNVMSPLKFLLGSEEVKTSTPNQFLYDSYTVQHFKNNIKLTNNSEEFLRKFIQNTTQENATARTNSQKKTRKVPQEVDASELKAEPSEVRNKITVTGMEMFTMPQTLINMDYDQINTPRYNPTLNSTVPFGSILSFKIDLTSAGLGFSHKTGTLTLKIFDRSRLVEIADFLNPRLYSRATLWITYGWRAPQQFPSDNNGYLSMINQSMLKKEAYGISNSSVSMSDDGTCTVTLNLFMKFANELSTISETVGSAAFNSTLEFQREKMSELRDIAKRLGLQTFAGTGAGDVRGEVLIKSALEAKIPSLDSKGLESEMKSIDEALKDNKNPDAIRFRELVSELYSVAGGSDKSKTMASLDAAAKIASSDRFKILKETHDLDLWAVVNLSDKTNSKFEPNNDPSYVHPLSKLYPTVGGTDKNGQVLDQGPFGRFGSISFARLFAVYFSSATTFTSDTSPIDEYQVIFYNFNDYAGYVSNMNIGEFPIDVDLLRKHYEQEIVKQKGENFTLVKFLEIVRTSQFGNIRHKAFGFSDLFDEKEGKILKEKNDEFVKKQFYNQGLGASFTLPAVDFHIETSTSLSDGNSEDLLVTYQAGATMLASTLNGTSRPSGYKKILRIHIYDKASMAHKEAYDIMRSNDGAFVEVESSWKRRYRRNQNKIIDELKKGNVTVNKADDSNQPPDQSPKKPKKKVTSPPKSATLTIEDYEKAQTSILSPETNSRGKRFGYRVQTFEQINASSAEPAVGSAALTELVTKTLDFGSGDPKMTFDRVKREISKFVPTIIYGSNGTLIKSVNYGSEQDAALATIMMLRNKTDDENVTNVNGSSKGDLPLRVIPGQLSITTLGCPLLEYMQQYFVDLGTGTTIDNIYSITGLSHNFSPGSFTSEIKFTFADAYGKYEGAQPMEAQIKAMADQIKNQGLNQSKSGQGGKKKK